MYDEKFVSKTPLRFKGNSSFSARRDEMSNTIDLRGYRVDEALDSLELFLDKASLVNLTPYMFFMAMEPVY